MKTERAETYYFKELDRRKDLDSAPTFRVAVLALVGGVFSYYTQHLALTQGWLSWLFLVAAGAVVVFAALSIIWMVRLYVGFSWGYLPSPELLEGYYRELCDYGEKFGFDSGGPEEAFDKYLGAKYVEAATLNVRNNNARSELLYRASFFLAIAVFFTLLAGVPLLFQAVERAIVAN
jgi:hypothetical protein